MSRTVEDVRQHSAPLTAAERAKVVAVQVEQIEGIEDRFCGGTAATATTKRFLQGGEVSRPALVEHDGLAIDNRAVQVEMPGIPCDRRKAAGPVVAGPMSEAGRLRSCPGYALEVCFWVGS
ncbi:hypothetical protein QO004_004304 [Rhizobium mesoamericanum]|nr:hypothetical protein [Rhizobium mesoamericanum]MDQ0562499.1 hypothetical protein [Rhizobium mesoamericanum]